MSQDSKTRVLKPMSRRQFTRLLAAAPLTGAFVARSAQAEGMAAVDPESATAQQLQYEVESTHEGQTCENCMLYQAGESAETGMCPLFAGSAVPSAAWCSAWVVKV